MKAKTISKTIKEKMEDFIDSIEDEELQNSLKRNIVVTGGCIASMFLKEKVNDYDIYLKSKRCAFRVARHYCEKMNAANAGNTRAVKAVVRVTFEEKERQFNFCGGQEYAKKLSYGKHWPTKILVDEDLVLTEHEISEIQRVEVFVRSAGVATNQTEVEYEYFESRPQEEAEEYVEAAVKVEEIEDKKEKYRVAYMSSNAITLSDKVQIVLRFTGDPEEIHDTYDFVHATNWWTFKDGLVTNTKALEALLARELIYRGSKYPLASIFRSRKFIMRGWNMHVGNYVKMALQLNEIDLFDPEELEEQLTGVDMAYMQEVITAVKKKKAEDENFEFNATYLCELVERLMG